MERYYGVLIDFVDGKELEYGRYYAYDSGEIYDNVKEGYLSYKPRCDGYCNIMLYLNTGIKVQFYVHRVIAATLIDNRLKCENNLVVNHLNPEVRYDNSVSNIEVCTQKENINYAIELGRFKVQGEYNPTANLTNEIVHKICSIMEQYPDKKYRDIAGELNIDNYKGIEDTIGKIRQWKEWVHISSQYNLQRRVRSCMNQFDIYKPDIKELLIENPELKASEISNLLNISLPTKNKRQSFHNVVKRMKKKLL